MTIGDKTFCFMMMFIIGFQVKKIRRLREILRLEEQFRLPVS